MLKSEATTFTLDNQGRFLCNTLQEALDSAALTLGGRSLQRPQIHETTVVDVLSAAEQVREEPKPLTPLHPERR